MDEKEYIKLRIDDQIKWYSDKAKANKCLYNWTKIAIIVFSAIIPLIAGLSFVDSAKDIILGLLGTIIAIIAGISGLLKFQEKWTEYRATSETLKHEKMLFLTKTTPYNKKDESFEILVTTVENLISKEHTAWSECINNEN